HPTRTSGAAALLVYLAKARMALRSSPDANVGCSSRERSPFPTLGTGLRSSPDANVGCSPGDPAPDGLESLVAILTRRERRVQPVGSCPGRAAVPGCDPHPTRTSGAARRWGAVSRAPVILRSSPDANVGCSDLVGQAAAPPQALLRSSPDANV